MKSRHDSSKKRIIRSIAMLLCILMVWTALPIEALESAGAAGAATGEPVQTEEADGAIATGDAVEEETTAGGEDASTEEEALVLWEIDGERSADTKTYYMSNGSFTTVTYPYPVHYSDGDEWAEIDNTLFAENSEYVNTASDVQYAFSAGETSLPEVRAVSGNYQVTLTGIEDVPATENNSDPVDSTQNEETLEDADTEEPALGEAIVDDEAPMAEAPTVFALEDATDSSAAPEVDSAEDITEDVPPQETVSPQFSIQLHNPQSANSVAVPYAVAPFSTDDVPYAQSNDQQGIALEDAMRHIPAAGGITYASQTGSEDYQYALNGNRLKESILIPSVQGDSYVYSYRLSATGLTPVLNDNGSVSLMDGETEAFVMPTPYMFDAKGNKSMAVTYALNENADGTWNFMVTADATWVNDQERVFPVTVDPSLYAARPNNGGITTQSASDGDMVNLYTNDDWMYIGRNETHGNLYSYVKFNQLPALPGNTRFCKAGISFSIPYNSYTGTTCYDNHNLSSFVVCAQSAVNSAWGTQFLPTSDTNYHKNNNPILDYQTINTSSRSINLNVTDAVGSWERDNTTNNGLVIYGQKTDGTWMDSSAYANVKVAGHYLNDGIVYGPILTVEFQNYRGTENCFTYQSASAGRAGSIAVSDYTGNMILSHTDVSDGYTLSHIYNSFFGDKKFTNNEAFHTVDYSRMNVGNGWKLSAQESIVNYPFTNYNGTASEYLIYTDADGTEHYFQSSATDEFKDEEGMGLTITRTGKNYIMKDDKNNYKSFMNGYLAKIVDSNYNLTAFCYNNVAYSTTSSTWLPGTGVNQLTSIVQVNTGKNPYTVATLTYTDNKLTKITDRYQRETNFLYTNGESDAQLLTTIQEPGSLNENATSSASQVEMKYYYDPNCYNCMYEAYDSESLVGIEFSNNVIPFYLIRMNQFASPVADNVSMRSYLRKANYYFTTTGKTNIRDWGQDLLQNTDDDLVYTYMFDDFGRTISTTCVDAKGKTLSSAGGSYTKNSGTAKTNNRLLAEGSSGTVAQNLVVNGGAESTQDWIFPDFGADSWSGFSGVQKRDGACSIQFHNKNNRINSQAVQSVWIPKAGTYTLSAYVKVTELSDKKTDTSGFYLQMGDVAVNTPTQRITEVTDSSVDGGWQHVFCTVNYTQAHWVNVLMGLSDATGYAFVDHIQLELGDCAGSYNYVQDGNFSGGLPAGSSVQNAEIAVQIEQHDGSMGNTMLLRGGIGRECVYSHDIPLSVYSGGSTPRTFLLSGWGFASSVPLSETTRTFQLSAKLLYSDGTFQYETGVFNADIRNQWQYLCLPVVPKKSGTISAITVYCSYKQNVGDAFFDDLSLTAEPCATYTYNSDGKVTAVNSTNKDEMQYSYSGANLISSAGGAGGQYTYTYDSKHNLTKAVNAGLSQTMTYDSAGEMTETILKSTNTSSPQYMKTSATYTSDGSAVSSVTDNLGCTTTYDYTAATYGNPAKITSPVAETSGRETSQQSYVYDASDRQTMTYISGKISLTNGYTNGRLSSITRGGYIAGNSVKQEQVYSFAHDGFGNTTSTSIGDRILASYTYNRNLIQSATYGNNTNPTYTYTYDSLDRLKTKSYGTITETYFYDSNSAVAKMECKDNNVLQKIYLYERDSLGRTIRTSTMDGTGKKLQSQKYEYNSKNQLVRSCYYDGGNTRQQLFTYKTNGTFATYTAANSVVTTFYYDSLNRISSKDYSPTGDTAKKISVQYEYQAGKASNQTTALVTGMKYQYDNCNNTTNADFKTLNTYDNVGNITETTYKTHQPKDGLNASGTANYVTHISGRFGYDDLNQMNYEEVYEYDDHYTKTYDYDTYGNIRQISYYPSGGYGSYGEVHFIAEPSYKTVTYGYDDPTWKDLLTSYNGHTITYDAIGNPLTYYNGKSYNMTWQNGRQLSTLTTGGKTSTYTYDKDGMRVRKNVNGTAYTYLYSDGKLIIQEGNGEKFNFVYDENGLPQSFFYRKTNTNDYSQYYYVRNAQGDVLQLRDSNNDMVAQYHYDAWGKLLYISDNNGNKITNQSNIAYLNPIRYRGYYYDSETGLYYVSSRYYDPETCRFINADSVISGSGQSVQGYNLFEYCNNNPVNKSDSTGTWPKWIKNAASAITKAAKKVVSVVTNAVNSIKSSFSPANNVQKTHVTTPTAMLNLGTLFGKVGFSSTVTKQNKEPGLVHSASDIGNDASKYSAGINIVGWLGADVGVSSEINAFVSAQVTPWVHGEVSFGLDGIGAVIGFDVGDTSYDFEINGGWGLIAIFVAPQILASGGQPSGAPAY